VRRYETSGLQSTLTVDVEACRRQTGSALICRLEGRVELALSLPNVSRPFAKCGHDGAWASKTGQTGRPWELTCSACAV
jgi:hypothetical protein